MEINRSLRKFAISSALAASVDFFVYTFTYAVLGVDITLAVALGFLSAFLISFNTQKNWVFESSSSATNALGRFTFVVICNLMAQVLLVSFLVELGVNYIMAKIALVGILFFVNYYISRKWIYA